MTYTYAILEVSQRTYDEIKRLLTVGSYQHAFHENGRHGIVIDMHGIALAIDETPPRYVAQVNVNSKNSLLYPFEVFDREKNRSVVLSLTLAPARHFADKLNDNEVVETL